MNYIEAYDTVFIPINNNINSFCYHLTVVQQMHLSKTFNQLISNYTSGNIYIDSMLMPFKTYAKITKENYHDIYKQMKIDYEKMIKSVIGENGKNGYSPFILLYFYILPIVYHCFPSQFKQICIETSIDPVFLRNPDVSVENQLENYSLIKSDYIKLQEEMTRKMNSDHIEFIKSEFRGGILEVYPNSHSYDGGHALFILKNKGSYYILDDDTTIDYFNQYVNNRKGFIHKICIRGIDDQVANDLQSLWGGNIMTKCVNNRYEIICKDSDQPIKQICKSILKIKYIEPEPLNIIMTGGNTDDKPIFIILIISFVVIVIVIVIVSIITTIIRNFVMKK